MADIFVPDQGTISFTHLFTAFSNISMPWRFGQLYNANSNIPPVGSGPLRTSVFRNQTSPRPQFTLANTSGTGMSMNSSGAIIGAPGGNITIPFLSFLTGTPAIFHRGFTFTMATGILPNGATVDGGGNLTVGALVSAGNNTGLSLRATNGWGKSANIPLSIILSQSVSALVQRSRFACGSDHSLVLDNTGALHAFGKNSNSQLGDGNVVKRATPFIVSFGTMAGKTIVHVAAGTTHTMLVDSSGALHAVGSNSNYQLGDGTNNPKQVSTLSTAGSLAGKNIIFVACGASYSLALDSSGTMHGFGVNANGELGRGTTTSGAIPAPSAGGSLNGKTIVHIAAGENHTLALDSQGAIHAFGSNSFGQLGNGNTNNQTTPFIITAGTLNGKTIVKISCGVNHSMAIDSEGALHAFGGNWLGQLGDGTADNKSTPFRVVAGTMSGKIITHVACGVAHTIALDAGGRLQAFGYNYYGQLGDGTNTSQSTPITAASNSLNGKTIVHVASRGHHTLALDSQGAIHAFGNNIDGQVGIVNETSSADPWPPTQVTTGTLFGKIISA